MDKKHDATKKNPPQPKKQYPTTSKLRASDGDEAIQLKDLASSRSPANVQMQSVPNLMSLNPTSLNNNFLNVETSTGYSSSLRSFDSRRSTFDKKSVLSTNTCHQPTDGLIGHNKQKSPATENGDDYSLVFSNDQIHTEPFSDSSPTRPKPATHNQISDEAEILFQGYVAVAFGYLRQCDQPRLLCLRLITSPWFERISMCIILINCITLGMYQPCEDNPCVSTKCVVLKYVDHLIYVFFVVEMGIKIVAMGFRGKNTYMAETWNRLDFFIVVAG